MTFGLNRLKRIGREVEHGWPGYMFGGHVRTSTIGLILVFLATWWLYNTYRPAAQQSPETPATQVVPPGFVPDPNYTWVPRSKVQQPPSTVTVTLTPTATTITAPPTTTVPTTTSPPPPFQLPVLPPLFGPAPSTTPGSTPPPPGPLPGLPPLGR